MTKKKLIDIDAEFDGLEFDEHAIRVATGVKNRPASWSANVAEANRKKHANPEFAKKLGAANRGKSLDPVWRAKMAEANRKKHADPEYKKAYEAGRKKIDQKAVGKKMAADPEWQRKHKEQVSKLKDNPIFMKKTAENNKAKVNDPEYRKNLQAGIDKRNASPEWQAMQAERRKPVLTPYGAFDGVKIAALALIEMGVANADVKNPIVSASGMIRYNIKTKKDGWAWISKEEYIMLTGKE